MIDKLPAQALDCSSSCSGGVTATAQAVHPQGSGLPCASSVTDAQLLVSLLDTSHGLGDYPAGFENLLRETMLDGSPALSASGQAETEERNPVQVFPILASRRLLFASLLTSIRPVFYDSLFWHPFAFLLGQAKITIHHPPFRLRNVMQVTPWRKNAEAVAPATPASKTEFRQTNKRTRADGELAPRRRGRKPQLPEGYEQQVRFEACWSWKVSPSCRGFTNERHSRIVSWVSGHLSHLPHQV